MMLDQNLSLTKEICHCVAGLAQDHSALQQLLKGEVVSSLLEVLEDLDFDTKTAAVNALYQIVQRDQNSCRAVVNSGKMVSGTVQLKTNCDDQCSKKRLDF